MHAIQCDLYMSVDERGKNAIILVNNSYSRTMHANLSGKHNKCITHEKPSKKRENIAPMLLTYIMLLCPFIQLVFIFIFGNETNKRGFSQLLRLLIYLFILLHAFRRNPWDWLWFRVNFMLQRQNWLDVSCDEKLGNVDCQFSMSWRFQPSSVTSTYLSPTFQDN